MASGLSYATHEPLYLVGTKDANNAITAVALTSAYQSEAAGHPTKTFPCGGFSRIEFSISYTEGATESANSIQWKIEHSPDLVNFYQLPTDSTSGGTSTIAAREWTYTGADAANAKIDVGIDIAYKNLRISFKETGVATNAGTVYCEALLSGY